MPDQNEGTESPICVMIEIKKSIVFPLLFAAKIPKGIAVTMIMLKAMMAKENVTEERLIIKFKTGSENRSDSPKSK